MNMPWLDYERRALSALSRKLEARGAACPDVVEEFFDLFGAAASGMLDVLAHPPMICGTCTSPYRSQGGRGHCAECLENERAVGLRAQIRAEVISELSQPMSAPATTPAADSAPRPALEPPQGGAASLSEVE